MKERAEKALAVVRAMLENGYELYEPPARDFLLHAMRNIGEDENREMVRVLHTEFPEQIERALEVTDLNRRLGE